MTEYARRLGLFSGTLTVVGGIIGSGIFLNPAIVAQRVGTGALTVVVWSLGAVVAIAGAFIFAELGQRMPKAGGQYAYIRAAFGSAPAFLNAWALLLMVSTGAVAAVTFTFASYFVGLFALPQTWTKGIAVGAIAVLTLINILGVTWGAWVQNVFTVLKLGAIAALVAVVFFGPTPTAPAVPIEEAPSNLSLAIGAGLVPVLFAYGGWQQTNMIAEEFVDPKRVLPRAIIAGVLIVVLAYLLTNAAYLRALGGGSGLAASAAPAADTMSAYLGAAGKRFISAGIVASTFGFSALTMLAMPRVYQATARDGLFFRSFATLHPRFRTPVLALVTQGAWAVVLVLSNRYGQLLDYVVFADWIFFALTALALVVIRRQTPETAGFRCPVMPLTVGIFVLAAAYVVAGSIWSNPGNAARGAALLLLGLPVYWYWARRSGGVQRAANS